ncbi:MAG: hypothetical protein AAF805_10395 [Planctomycetota bacterium]
MPARRPPGTAKFSCRMERLSAAGPLPVAGFVNDWTTVLPQIIAAGVLASLVTAAGAADRFWSFNALSPDWGVSGNWAPSGSPAAADDVQIGSSFANADATRLDADYAINSLELRRGASLSTEGFVLAAAGEILITGVSSTGGRASLAVPPTAGGPAVRAGDLVVSSDGDVLIGSAAVEVDGEFDVRQNGRLIGSGVITAARIRSDATIAAAGFAAGQPVADDAAVLTLQNPPGPPPPPTMPGGNRSMDLSGTFGQGRLEAVLGSIVVASPLDPAFNGPAEIGPGRSISFAGGAIGPSGAVTLGGAAGSASELSGQGVVGTPTALEFHGRLNVVDELARVQGVHFRDGAEIILDGGTLEVAGRGARIDGAVNFRDHAGGPGTVRVDNAPLTLGDGLFSSVTLEVSGGQSVIQIEPGGIGAAIVGNLDALNAGQAEFRFDLGGGVSSDRLVVSREAAIGGELILDFDPSAGPTPFSRWTIVESLEEPIVGRFGIVPESFPAAPVGTNWSTNWYVDYSRSDRVEVWLQLDGDFNRDGRVDAADYTVWRDTNLQSVELLADINDDQTVDASDYALWADRYAAVINGSAATIPEPAAAWLLSIGLLRVLRKRA